MKIRILEQSLIISVLTLCGCAVGPDYQRPSTELPLAWKENQPQTGQDLAQWWEIFKDPELNRLEVLALEANQDLRRAASRVEEARALARISAADFYPSLTADPSYQRSKTSGNRASFAPFPLPAVTSDTFRAPLDLSYEVDIWGRVRRSFEASTAETQAHAAVYHTVRLTLTADVAQNYFLLRSLDAERVLLERTVGIYRDSFEINRSRFKAGLTSAIETSQAETELETVQSDLPDVARRRSEVEHALAVLCGQAPSQFTLPLMPLDVLPPVIPAGLPSELLERRPDIIEAERLLAAANARIGVAKAAFFPTLRLTGVAGFESADLVSLFDWKSRIWSLGPSISFPIFEGGRNQANLEATRARYEEAVSEFRQRILVAFREVEDALSNLRLRSVQAQVQARAIASARDTTALADSRYRQGLANYLQVVDATRTQLRAERSATQTLGQRLAYSVLLVKALGGGWGTVAAAEPEMKTSSGITR